MTVDAVVQPVVINSDADLYVIFALLWLSMLFNMN